MEPEELEGQVDAEVDKIMTELAAGILAPAGSAPVGLKKQAASVSKDNQYSFLFIYVTLRSLLKIY
jgi:hypothetical protein